MNKWLMIGLIVGLGVFSAQADAIWSENFDGLGVGTGDLVNNPNPVFGSAAPDVTTGQWVVGDNTRFSVVDQGGGDLALSLATVGVGVGAAIWLDVSTLGLSAGTYDMQFTIANYVEDETGFSAATQFANVIKAKGVDAAVTNTVTLDLQRAANWDVTVSEGDALIATDGAYGTSLLPSSNGQTEFFANGTFTHSFTVAADDEYIGLIIASRDGNSGGGGASVAFDVTNISIIPEPATIGMLGFGALVSLLIRRFAI